MEAYRLIWGTNCSSLPIVCHEAPAIGSHWHFPSLSLQCYGMELGSIRAHPQLAPNQPHTFARVLRTLNLRIHFLPCCVSPCMFHLLEFLLWSAGEWRARPPLSLTGGAHLSSPSSRRARRRARALAPPPPRIAPHPAVPARIKERGITPRVSLSRFPLFSLSLSLGFVRIHPAKFAGVFNGARDLRARFPLSPAALSPSRCYIFDPRASLFRFRRSPLALAVGFVLAPCSSLSAVAVDLRFAADVAPDVLPTRRHLHRLRRVVADPVRRSASPADRRSTVALGIPNRAVAFLRSDAAASEDPLFVEVEAVVWESEQGNTPATIRIKLGPLLQSTTVLPHV
ncbi:HGWP repeat containing protein-like [Oryza sativa Japonica Group]|uniref:HGWP repeat containing protein-like n=1 Tax=Oryza sativa subsp. japonica TaxID=39947 RepID=Q5ZB44_ORYSJ|nr:HGWP repeat containing protein-like [Oryza sativa Japonica Group]BAD53197.1 HGWP repeat containing protein-like [Oryza sativa Japonica Group]